MKFTASSAEPVGLILFCLITCIMIENPFNVKDLDSCVESAYSGHNGNGNNYGCNDQIRDEFCEKSCRLYGAKKNSEIIGFDGMEDNALNSYF